MIARSWHGRVPKEKAEAFHALMSRTGLAEFPKIPGNRGIFLYRRDEGEITHFLLITHWDSYEAIKKFSGPDPEKARYFPGDDDYLLEKEPTVTHYEVVTSP